MLALSLLTSLAALAAIIIAVPLAPTRRPTLLGYPWQPGQQQKHQKGYDTMPNFDQDGDQVFARPGPLPWATTITTSTTSSSSSAAAAAATSCPCSSDEDDWDAATTTTTTTTTTATRSSWFLDGGYENEAVSVYTPTITWSV
jgi:hypothetical protein